MVIGVKLELYSISNKYLNEYQIICKIIDLFTAQQ
jgi:hypothetical protein